MHTHSNHKSGFSLIELIITMFLGVIVVGALIYISSGQRKGFLRQKSREESQESVSRIHGELLDKIRVAGHMIPDSVDAIVPFYVTDGPDSIRVTGNYDNFISTIKFGVSVGSDLVIAKYSDRFKYTQDMKLYIQKPFSEPIIEDCAEVDTAFVFYNSGEKLIAFYLANGIARSYASGSRVSTFNSYTIKVKVDDDGNPYCAYTINGLDKEYVLVEGIEDLTLTYETRGDTTERTTMSPASNIYCVNIEVESRAQTADYQYVDTIHNDNYRRQKMKAEVVVLNLSIEKH